jgi:phenylacetate-CoA ligase
MPVLKRETVNQLGDGLLSTNIPKAHGPLNPTYTSGTTGRPVRVVRTRHALTYWSAFTTRDHIWHNRNIKGSLAGIRSSEIGFAPYPAGVEHAAWGTVDDVFKTGHSYSLNLNTPLPDMARWIAGLAPDYLIAMSNVITRLAPYCIENGIAFPGLKEVHVIGEMCGVLMREQCREAWDVPLHANYTSREIGYMALQCPVHDHYHVQSEGVYLEILDDDDQPCKPGQTGKIVVTALHNYAMPLIRYEIGDYAEVGARCDCGRGLPVINRILGRAQEILILPTGERRWTMLGRTDLRDFMEMAPFAQFQFAHVAPDRIEVRLAAKRTVTAAEEAKIAKWVCKKFGYPFDIRFAYLDEIPLTAGKFRDFVVEF